MSTHAIYDCLSVDIACLTKSDKGQDSFEDVFSILQGIKATQHFFLFHLVDVGPFETFENYNILREAVHSIKAVDFTPRLITSGKYFGNASETSAWFRELTASGAEKIVLRLDQVAAESLPENNVIAFVNACGDCGISPDIIFELEDSVPEILFRLLRLIEQTRFYTDLYTRIKARPRLCKFMVDAPIKGLGLRAFRVVVMGDGEVILRTHSHGDEEINIGSLRDMPFQEIVDPNRLGKTGKDVV